MRRSVPSGVCDCLNIPRARKNHFIAGLGVVAPAAIDTGLLLNRKERLYGMCFFF